MFANEALPASVPDSVGAELSIDAKGLPRATDDSMLTATEPGVGGHRKLDRQSDRVTNRHPRISKT